MDKIDLDDIIDIKYETSFGRAEVHKFMRQAIHKALVLASKNATVGRVYKNEASGITDYWVVKEQSILDVEKLVV